MDNFKGQNILNLVKEFPNDDACKAYLSKIKWIDGFKCSKCEAEKGCEKAGFTYHCYRCNHVESATFYAPNLHTLTHYFRKSYLIQNTASISLQQYYCLPLYVNLVVAILKSSWGSITAFCIITRNASLWLIISPM